MRVFGLKAHMRNESECRCERRKPGNIDRSGFLMIDLSKSMYARTRKMVNYT
jgi:hypothetical protein